MATPVYLAVRSTKLGALDAIHVAAIRLVFGPQDEGVFDVSRLIWSAPRAEGETRQHPEAIENPNEPLALALEHDDELR